MSNSNIHKADRVQRSEMLFRYMVDAQFEVLSCTHRNNEVSLRFERRLLIAEGPVYSVGSARGMVRQLGSNGSEI